MFYSMATNRSSIFLYALLFLITCSAVGESSSNGQSHVPEAQRIVLNGHDIGRIILQDANKASYQLDSPGQTFQIIKTKDTSNDKTIYLSSRPMPARISVPTSLLLFCLAAVFLVSIFYIRQLNKEIKLHEATEEELRAIQMRLTATVNSIGDGVIVTDAAGTIIQMNPVAEMLTGWLENQAHGISLNRVYQVFDDSDEKVDTFTSTLNGEPFEERELTLTAQDGKKFELLHNSSIMRLDGHTISGITVTFCDVTERNDIQTRLRHSQRMDSLGKLAGGIAHDFNNMLGGILGFSEMLEIKLKDNPCSKYAKIISSTANRAAELTGKLLSFSRRGCYQNQPIDFHQLIKESVLILERSIDKMIQIECVLNAQRPIIAGDPSELHNAILNLGLNARDAMTSGGILKVTTENVIGNHDLAVKLGVQTPAQHYLKVTVADTGTGIPSDIIENVFEPFFSTKKEEKGTGLGLAAVYGIVKDHNGEITVQSTEEIGTTFELYFPLTEMPVALIDADEDFEHEEIISKRDMVLIVDDEEVIRCFLSEFFSDLGFIVLVAEDGMKGLELFRENHHNIEMVILDVVMPNLNGKDCFNHMKNIDPDVNVIIASGYVAEEESLSELRSNGARAIIKKPFSRKEIRSVLTKI